MTKQLDVAILGGGCFWCLEAVYLEVRGVTRVESGYMGGHQPDPSYEQVCAGSTGHAEVVRLEFDPQQVSYHDLLEMFFTIHDPTTKNRQGNDVGTQYRSVIFVTSPEQAAMARQVRAEMANVWNAPLVTEVAALMEEHLLAHYAFYGAYLGVRTARKHIGWYVRSLPGGEAFRQAMNLLEDCDAQLAAVRRFFDAQHAYGERLQYGLACDRLAA